MICLPQYFPGKGVMPIKTRAEIYGVEASTLLQEISMYPGLTEAQLLRFHPGKESKVKTLLSGLEKQGRIQRDRYGRYLPQGGFSTKVDQNTEKAVWVLLDFLDRVDYHISSDFPVRIVFFSDGEEYEIICAAHGQEALISQAMRLRKEDAPRRIVVVESPSQINALVFPGICGYCTVSADGRVQYYQKRNGGTN